MICDDFLAQPHLKAAGEAARWLGRFERDWHIHNLVTVQAAREMAQEAGFHLVEAVDLSAYLRSFHPLVLRLVAWATQLPLRSAYWQNLSGGAALQVCGLRGWTNYLALIFEKEGKNVHCSGQARFHRPALFDWRGLGGGEPRCTPTITSWSCGFTATSLDRHGYLVDIVDIERVLNETVAHYRDCTLNEQAGVRRAEPQHRAFQPHPVPGAGCPDPGGEHSVR